MLFKLLALQALKHNLKQFRNSKLKWFFYTLACKHFCLALEASWILRACVPRWHVEFCIARPFEQFAFPFGGLAVFCEDEQGECDRLRRQTAGRNNSSKTSQETFWNSQLGKKGGNMWNSSGFTGFFYEHPSLGKCNNTHSWDRRNPKYSQ